MVNVPRTPSYLLSTSFPDNTTGLITPQNIRDFVVTSLNYNGPGSAQVLAYAPSGYAFATTPTASPSTLAAYYTTLANAQAVYPFATALSNYVDRCALQAAVNACSAAGGGVITLPPNPIYLDATVSWDGSKTSVIGSGVGLQVKTTFYTQTCGSSVAISINGGGNGFFNYNTPLSNVDFCAYNTGYVDASVTLGGVAATTYVTGSTALNITSAWGGVFRGLGFWNYDTPHSWSTGNIWAITFYDCLYNNGNNGPNITSNITNSFEGMRWHGGGSNNNNIGVNFNLGSNGAGSLFIESFSLDYNIVWHVYYDGLGGGNDTQWPLTITACHIETNSACSGSTTCRMYNNGNLILSNNNMAELGTFPPGFVQYTYITGGPLLRPRLILCCNLVMLFIQ